MENREISQVPLTPWQKLQQIYRGQGDGMSIARVEQEYSEKVAMEAFGMFMSACDGGMKSEIIKHEGITCNTFEYMVAEMVGHRGAERMRSLQESKSTRSRGVLRFLRLERPHVDAERDESNYHDKLVSQTLQRMREYDDVFVPRDSFDTSFSRAAEDVTLASLEEERAFYC